MRRSRYDPAGHDAERHFNKILDQENIPHKRATAKEDERKVDLWVWLFDSAQWAKVQLTVAKDPSIIATKVTECQIHHVALIYLDREDLQLYAASNTQKAKRQRAELVQRVLRDITAALHDDPLIGQKNCLLG